MISLLSKSNSNFIQYAIYTIKCISISSKKWLNDEAKQSLVKSFIPILRRRIEPKQHKILCIKTLINLINSEPANANAENEFVNYLVFKTEICGHIKTIWEQDKCELSTEWYLFYTCIFSTSLSASFELIEKGHLDYFTPDCNSRTIPNETIEAFLGMVCTLLGTDFSTMISYEDGWERFSYIVSTLIENEAIKYVEEWLNHLNSKIKNLAKIILNLSENEIKKQESELWQSDEDDLYEMLQKSDQ